MKHINEILSIIISLILIIASLCMLPILVKAIFCVSAILYGIWNFVSIFEKIHKEDGKQ